MKNILSILSIPFLLATGIISTLIALFAILIALGVLAGIVAFVIFVITLI